MGNLPFWLGIGAAQKSAGSKELKPSRHPIIAFVVGTLIALAIIAGMFALLGVERATLKYCSAQDARVATFRSYAVGGQ